MGKAQVVQISFDRAMRDLARDRMPKGSRWTIRDMIPQELASPIAKRGGWTYASPNLTAVLAGANRVISVSTIAFASGQQLLAVVRNDTTPESKLVRVDSISSVSDKGTMGTRFPLQNPVFYRNKLYFTDFLFGTVMVYDGSASIAALTGSPPSARFCTVYKDRLILAHDSTQPQRVWFADAGTPTTWNTTNGYIDTSAPVQAIYPLRNSILIIHQTNMERIIGNTPPPGTDMSLQPLFDVGTTYPMTLAGSDEFLCFANQSGVFMTDGSSIVDITAQGGMKSYWRTQFTAAHHMSGTYYRGYYFVSLINSTSLVGLRTWMIHLQTRRFIELTNVSAWSLANDVSTTDEMYWADSESARVNTLSPIFEPGTSNKADADGSPILPVIETPYYNVGQSKARLKNAYITYQMEDAATDNPTLELSYITHPDHTSYTPVTGADGNPYLLADTNIGGYDEGMTRVRRVLHRPGFGVALKLAQTNNSKNTQFMRIELESHAREATRV